MARSTYLVRVRVGVRVGARVGVRVGVRARVPLPCTAIREQPASLSCLVRGRGRG